jgi:hypothetical protein
MTPMSSEIWSKLWYHGSPQFRAYTDADANTLKTESYKVTLNTRQPIHFIWLTQIDNRNVVIFLDRNTKLTYQINVIFPDFLHTSERGTLFEIERLDNIFLVTDLIMPWPFSQRYAFLKQIFLGQPDRLQWRFSSPHQQNILFEFQLRDYFTLNQMEELVNTYLPQLPWKSLVCGFLFKPDTSDWKLKQNIFLNFNRIPHIPTQKMSPQLQLPQPQPQKIKEEKQKDFNPSEFRIDCEIHKEVIFGVFTTPSGQPDDYFLKLKMPTGEWFTYTHALINDMKTSRYLQSLDLRQGKLFYCRYYKQFMKWKPDIAVQLPPDAQVTPISELS